MLTLNHISKDYDLRPILSDITFTLSAGTMYGLRAPNGAGKTTLLYIMAGLSKPSSGEVRYLGRALDRNFRRDLGVVFEDPFTFGHQTALENLRLYATAFGLTDPRRVANMWVNAVGLGHVGPTRVRDFSKGMKKRLSIARALLHRPKVILLDEPFDGLDKQGQALVKGLLERQLEEGSSIFMVSHHDVDHDHGHHAKNFVPLSMKLGRLVSA